MSETDHGCWYEPDPADEPISSVSDPLPALKRPRRDAAAGPATLPSLLMDPEGGPPPALWDQLERQLRQEGLIHP